MKKTLFAISAIAVLLGFTACTSENETIEPQKGKTITIKAYTEEATRTALDGNDTEGYSVVWSEGDKITVGNTSSDIEIYQYTLSKGAGTTYGEFSGGDCTVPGHPYDVWYGGVHFSSGDSYLPEVQTYKAGTITNSPMHTTIFFPEDAQSGDDLAPIGFKNLCGLLRLSVKGATTIKSITISANEPMAGKFTINEDGGAVVESTGKKSITLDCGEEGVTLNETTATDFYIAMPENKDGYTGVRITLQELTEEYAEEKHCIKRLSSTKPLVITRSKITPAAFTADQFYPVFYGHTYVELGGYYWATENVGAVEGVEAVSGVGATGNGYDCYFYPFKDNSTGENVAAKAAEIWGSLEENYTWKIPSVEVWQALIDGCYWEWTDSYNGKTGYKGYIVYEAQDDVDAGKVNTPESGHTYTIADKHIFLPAAGSSSESGVVSNQGTQLLYGAYDIDYETTGQLCGTSTEVEVEVKSVDELTTGLALRLVVPEMP